jgi:hypothetical protein
VQSLEDALTALIASQTVNPNFQFKIAPLKLSTGRWTKIMLYNYWINFICFEIESEVIALSSIKNDSEVLIFTIKR